ncbi:MAG: hypothetical protein LBT46_11650 [Planctomycetaceae bacterium]|jgi:hypothetical protein|nr:hypothetical protein [Planctomycetaceae bacterium]
MSFGFSPVMPSTANDVKAHERTAESAERAANAQGVGSDDKESQAASNERDADGRQAWQWNRHNPKRTEEAEHKVHDLSGQTGVTLDLDG